MKSITTTIIISATLAAGVATALPVLARDVGGYPGCMERTSLMEHGMRGDPDARIERMFEQLDLTATQRTSVRAIVDKNRPQLRELQDRLADSHKQLRTLTTENAPDEAKLRGLADTQGKLMADMIVLRTRMRSAIDQVLTPAQREQLQERRGGAGAGGGGDRMPNR